MAEERERDKWRPGRAEDQPVEAPLPLGARVEYTGLSSWVLENGVPVHRGEEGVVVDVEPPGQPGTETELPEDGYSVVRFHDVESDEDVLWPRNDDWRTRYRPIDEP